MNKTSVLAVVCSFAADANKGGVFSYRLLESGQLEEITESPSPAVSFITDHPTKPVVYTVNRVNGGEITAYVFDETTGTIDKINSQSTGGTDPCYVSVDSTGSLAFVANYSGGTVAAFPLNHDGSLNKAAETITHSGSSVHEDRQEGPHPHSIQPDPANHVVYVPDLGTDEIRIYDFDPEQATFEPADPPRVELPPGSGPRHLDSHPELPYCYVINELASTITTLSYDSGSGQLTPTETTSTLPEEFDGHHQAADIHVHPSGTHLYASNRGHDSIAIFEIDDETGGLDLLGFESTRGSWPRNFAIDPTGSVLFVENRRSDTVIGFMIDQNTGLLTPTGQTLYVPEPVCMRFFPGQT